MPPLVHELDVVRLIPDADGWPAGTEGTALVALAGRVSIEPPFGFDGFNYIEATDWDVEVIWRPEVGYLSPPLRADDATG